MSSVAPERTVAELPNQVVNFDLMWLRLGQTLEVSTGNSHYWITRTEYAEPHVGRRSTGFVTGFAIQSDGRHPRFPHSPIEQMCERTVVVGERLSIIGDCSTSPVESFRIL